MGICFGDLPPSATVRRVCTQIVDGGTGAESSAHTGAAPTPNEPDPSTVRCCMPTMLSFFFGCGHNGNRGRTIFGAHVCGGLTYVGDVHIGLILFLHGLPGGRLGSFYGGLHFEREEAISPERGV